MLRLNGLHQEPAFHTMLTLEQRRAERSRTPFVLILLDSKGLFTNGIPEKLLRQLIKVFSSSSRDTDLIGWYKQDEVLGLIFTEVSLSEKTQIMQLLLTKVVKALHSCLSLQLASKVAVTLYLYPETESYPALSGSEPVVTDGIPKD